MAKLQLIPFRPEHLEHLQARSFEARELALVNNLRETLEEYLRRGAAFTGVIDGVILACGGMFLLWRGVAEVWLVTTPRVAQYPKSFHRAIKNGLEALSRAFGVWRIQCALHHRHMVSQKWVQRLGFKWEAPMPGYGPDGAAYVRFALLIPENLPKEIE